MSHACMISVLEISFGKEGGSLNDRKLEQAVEVLKTPKRESINAIALTRRNVG